MRVVRGYDRRENVEGYQRRRIHYGMYRSRCFFVELRKFSDYGAGIENKEKRIKRDE